MPSIQSVSSLQRNQRPLKEIKDTTYLDEFELLKHGLDSKLVEVQSTVPRLIEIRQEQDRFYTNKGSAFLISPDGFLLTANHNVSNKGNSFLSADFAINSVPHFKPLVQDQLHFYSMSANVVFDSPKDELALLCLDLRHTLKIGQWPYLELNLDEPRNGETVYSVGHDAGKRLCYVTPGEVLTRDFNMSALLDPEKPEEITSAIASSNNIKKGSSGGPLCNEAGRAYGVMSSTLRNSNHVKGISLINLISSRLNRNPFNYIPEVPPRQIVFSIKIKEQVLPFLKRCGVDIDKFLQGKPLRSSNKIMRRLKKL